LQVQIEQQNRNKLRQAALSSSNCKTVQMEEPVKDALARFQPIP